MCQIADEVRDRTDDSIRLIGGAVAAMRSYGSWPTVYVRGDTWLQWFAEMGGLDYVDGISVHFYHHLLDTGDLTYNDSFMRLDLEFLDSLLGANNARDKELWVTECGSSSGAAGISPPPWENEATQAASMVAYNVAGLAAAGLPVKPCDRVIQYTLVDDDGTAAGSLGLLGLPTDQPPPGDGDYPAKASHRVYRQMAEGLTGATMNGRVEAGDATHTDFHPNAAV